MDNGQTYHTGFFANSQAIWNPDDLFVKLKYESSTIILLVGIRYSMRDLLSDLNNYAWPAN